MYHLAAVELVIANEIKQGLPQKEIAKTYAMGIVSSWPTDWKVVNELIKERWPKGLERIKRMAWKEIERQKEEARRALSALRQSKDPS